MPQYVDSVGKGYWAKTSKHEGDRELGRNPMWDQVVSAPEKAVERASKMEEAKKAPEPEPEPPRVRRSSRRSKE